MKSLKSEEYIIFKNMDYYPYIDSRHNSLKEAKKEYEKLNKMGMFDRDCNYILAKVIKESNPKLID